MSDKLINPSEYIHSIENLFLSKEWTSRSKALGMENPAYYCERSKGLWVARPRSGIWSDIEPWPNFDSWSDLRKTVSGLGCDWLVHRKLLPAQRPLVMRVPGYVTHYSLAPYLNLLEPLAPRKETLAHIQRCERKITREIGPLALKEATEADKCAWFDSWVSFETSAGRFGADTFRVFRRWITEGELPPWMKLLTLEAGNKLIAVGIFYIWNGVFYYYSPIMSPDPELRKYGPGKLFVQKLIEYAKQRDCAVFDFLQGEHEYKFQWNPRIRELYQCIIPTSLRGRLALSGYKIQRWTKTLNSQQKTLTHQAISS